MENEIEIPADSENLISPQQQRRLEKKTGFHDSVSDSPAAGDASHPNEKIGFRDNDETFAAPETVFIDNAGLVLSGPFLPMLFKRVNLLEKGIFRSDAAAEKAVHILEYMATGEVNAPEYRLGLNKILCGIDIGSPIQRRRRLYAEDKKLTEALIRSMIAHWQVLGHTSVKGFRESFLAREGKLTRTDEFWSLNVDQKPYDLLLDRIPWTYSYLCLS